MEIITSACKEECKGNDFLTFQHGLVVNICYKLQSWHKIVEAFCDFLYFYSIYGKYECGFPPPNPH